MTEERAETCPICKLVDNAVIRKPASGDSYFFDCPRCKQFFITLEAHVETNDAIPKISAWIRDLNEQKVEVPTIDSNKLKDLKTDLPEKSPREK